MRNKKLSNIVSLCLVNLMGISSVCAREEKVPALESNVSLVDCQNKQDDSVDPKKKSNMLRNALLLSLFGGALTFGMARILNSYVSTNMQKRAAPVVISSFDDWSREANQNPAFVEHWKIVDKNLLKVTVENMLDYCLEHFDTTPPDLSEAKGFFTSQKYIEVAILTVSKFIMGVLKIPNGNSPGSFPNIGEISTFILIPSADPKLYINVEHCNDNGKESIKFTIKGV